MSTTIEKRDGKDWVIQSDLPNWARPATPDESALWAHKDARIAELEAELDTMNLACGYFHEENDKFITRIGELECRASQGKEVKP
jgi:hypothetical protein